MKAMKHQYVPYLPYDILTNIFKRLEVKSLLRFQCVCKDWENLIKSPSFIQDHLHHTSTHQNPLLLISWVYSWDLHVGLLDLQNKLALEIQKPPLIDSTFWTINSSKGLVCIYVDSDLQLSLSHSPKKSGTSLPYILLWNPATRQLKKVPGTTMDLYGDYCLGFGFTPFDNDYKIVKIHVGKSCSLVNPVEVYSLNSKSWKEIEFENLEAAEISGRCGHVIVNSVMYCLNSNQTDVVSIDLARRVCTSIPLPHSDHSSLKSLDVYENKLALVVCNGYDSIRLWVMEEDTWILTKTHINRHYVMITERGFESLAIWRNKIVFRPFNHHVEDYRSKHLYMLDVTTGKFKIKHVTEHGPIFICTSYNYMESLVSIGNINDQ